MKKKIGVILIVTGLVLILSATGLLIFNITQSNNASKASSEVLLSLIEEIKHKSEENSTQAVISGTTLDTSEVNANELTGDNSVVIDGYSYIGVLSIKKLSVELPVMSDWDYDRLRIAPCRYIGSVERGDLIIAGHNYQSHFGRLSELSHGDEVIFISCDGKTYRYKVADIEVIPGDDTEDMIENDFDLTLYTCTYDSRSRVTVRCLADD